MFHRKKSVVLWIGPGLLMLLVFYIIPFVDGIRYSMLDGSRDHVFVGLTNYIVTWKNSMFQIGLRNTLELTLLCAPLLWVLSFFLALALSTLMPKGAFVRSTVLLPYLTPSSAILLVWLVLFDYGGPINRLFQAVGIMRIDWLAGSTLRIPIILLFLWKNLGFCTVIFLAALQSVSPALYEYAVLEGAGVLTRAFRISFPLILPSAFLVFVLSWMNAFKIFKEVYFIAGAYPSRNVYTLQHYMNNMFSKMNYQFVTAAAYIFAIIVIAFFSIIFLFQRRAVQSMS